MYAVIKEMTLTVSVITVMYGERIMFHTLLLVHSATSRHAVLSSTIYALVYFIFVKSSEQAQFVEKSL